MFLSENNVSFCRDVATKYRKIFMVSGVAAFGWILYKSEYIKIVMCLKNEKNYDKKWKKKFAKMEGITIVIAYF